MRRKLFLITLLLFSIYSIAWVSAECPAGTGEAASWGYQLQGADPAELAASDYDVIVMDYSRDGTDGGAYTPAEIQSIKDTGKIVLAYLSVGEAEEYRFYWKPSWRPGRPAWLGPENPDWPGNYKVRYWKTGWWRTAIRPGLDRILSAGFDGVYMDIIDAYWYWRNKSGKSLKFTTKKMVRLVKKIGRYTRSSSSAPGFILCPQNGESIIDDAPSKKVKDRYMNVIDAIGVEDLFYHYGNPGDKNYRLKLLQEYADAGKKVFNVEYIGEGSWDEYLDTACAATFEVIPYAGTPDRELDELVVFPQKECPTLPSAAE